MELVANDSFGQIFITDTHKERVNGVFEPLGITPNYFSLSNLQAASTPWLIVTRNH